MGHAEHLSHGGLCSIRLPAPEGAAPQEPGHSLRGEPDLLGPGRRGTAVRHSRSRGLWLVVISESDLHEEAEMMEVHGDA